MQILVAFNQPVELAEGAFELENLSSDIIVSFGSVLPSEDDVDVIATPVAGSNNTQFILTFDGDGVIPCDNSSGVGTGATTFNILKGGLYRLVTHKDLVTNADDEPMDDDHNDVFWTFFGAVAGGEVVINPDDWSAASVSNVGMGIFATTLGSSGEFGPWPHYIAAFDSTLNGEVSNDDLDDFLENYGVEWDWYGTVYSANDLVAFTATRYDADGRIIEQMSSDSLGEGLMDFRYGYDWAGQVTSKSENGDETKYGYDDAGQLTSETVTNYDNESFDTTTYNYDAAGNRTTIDRPDSSTQTYALGDGAGGDPDGNRYGTDGVWNFFYDGHTDATTAGEGNLTKKVKISTSEAWTYQYDNRNHLIKAEHTTNGAFEYDQVTNRTGT